MSYFIEYEITNISRRLGYEMDSERIKNYYSKFQSFDLDTQNRLVILFLSNRRTPNDVLKQLYHKFVRNNRKNRSQLIFLIDNPMFNDQEILSEVAKCPSSDVRWHAVRGGKLSKEDLEYISENDFDYEVKSEARRRLEKLKVKK